MVVGLAEIVTVQAPYVISPADWVTVQLTCLSDSACLNVIIPVLLLSVSVFSATVTSSVGLSNVIQSTDDEQS